MRHANRQVRLANLESKNRETRQIGSGSRLAWQNSVDDEYNSYVGQLATLIRENATDDALMQYLENGGSPFIWDLADWIGSAVAKSRRFPQRIGSSAIKDGRKASHCDFSGRPSRTMEQAQ